MSKQVKIRRIALANFKGLRNVAVDFGDTATTISGHNGTGKTTIADAFAWLLWGKDSEGNSDTKFGIKTTDANGDFIPDLEHEVIGNFDITDTETWEVTNVELRRVYVEEWRTPKGETERVLKGHRTDFFYNGVPLKTKTEYDAKVAAIIPEELFKVLTDPYYFLTLHWKAQRELLLQIAGTIDDSTVAATRADFAGLLNRVTGKTMEEYKKEVSTRRSKIEAQLDKIPTRKDEATRNTPVAPDYAALEAEKSRIESELTQIDAATTSAAEANRVAYEQAAKIQTQINEKRSQQQTALFNAIEAARTQAYEANKTADDAARSLSQVQSEERSEAAFYNRERQRIADDINRAEQRKKGYEVQKTDLIARWNAVNEAEYQEKEYTTAGPLLCPIFGHHCADPDATNRHKCDAATAAEQFRANQAKEREAFYAEQTKQLDRMDEEGQELNRLIEAQDTEIARLQKEAADLEKAHADKAAGYAAKKQEYEATIATHPRISTNPVIKGEDLPAWVALQNEIDQLTAQLPQAATQTDTADLRKRKGELTARLDGIKQKLGLRAIIEASAARIAELDKEAATLAQEKAALQIEEDLIDDFVKDRMAEVERRVNGLFSRVRFKMYKPLVNGEEEPDCVAFVEGTRYQDKNHAGQINAGLDVINTLCTYHGVTAPIFVDNAESVNDFIPTKGQLIKLVVTNGDFDVTPN